jgi:hypothetical protein
MRALYVLFHGRSYNFSSLAFQNPDVDAEFQRATSRLQLPLASVVQAATSQVKSGQSQVALAKRITAQGARPEASSHSSTSNGRAQLRSISPLVADL